MKNEKLWKGSALTRLYIMPAAGPLIIHYSLFIIHYSFNFSLSLRDKLKFEYIFFLSEKKKPGRSPRFVSHLILASNSAGYLARTQAACAGINSAGSAVDHSLHPFHIGLPGPVGSSVWVGHLDTELNAFTAIITFCHLSTPPLFLRNQSLFTNQQTT